MKNLKDCLQEVANDLIILSNSEEVNKIFISTLWADIHRLFRLANFVTKTLVPGITDSELLKLFVTIDEQVEQEIIASNH